MFLFGHVFCGSPKKPPKLIICGLWLTHTVPFPIRDLCLISCISLSEKQGVAVACYNEGTAASHASKSGSPIIRVASRFVLSLFLPANGRSHSNRNKS